MAAKILPTCGQGFEAAGRGGQEVAPRAKSQGFRWAGGLVGETWRLAGRAAVAELICRPLWLRCETIRMAHGSNFFLCLPVLSVVPARHRGEGTGQKVGEERRGEERERSKRGERRAWQHHTRASIAGLQLSLRGRRREWACRTRRRRSRKMGMQGARVAEVLQRRACLSQEGVG